MQRNQIPKNSDPLHLTAAGLSFLLKNANITPDYDQLYAHYEAHLSNPLKSSVALSVVDKLLHVTAVLQRSSQL